ncbi:MAG: VCBS repeat-containing protein, partial [Nitrospirae bacterium]|nr:VCBS repeat-containing protein [Nitrospirota bacterium]
MEKLKHKGLFVRSALLILLILLFGNYIAIAADPTEPPLQIAPLNPAFLIYQSQALGQAANNAVFPGHGALGYIPSPVDLSHLQGAAIKNNQYNTSTYPSSYDLRTTGKVTSVKNQSSCGICWIFATMGSMESNLMSAENRDFSENNVMNTHGFDLNGATATTPATPCTTGGNGMMTTAYLARWGGPMSESDDPYRPNGPYTSPLGISPQKHVQEVLYIPSRASATDNDNIKWALTTYGGVWAAFCADQGTNGTNGHFSPNCYSSGGNSTNCSYYYNSTNCTQQYTNQDIGGHAITIVGWDDNYPAGNFTISPPGNGAFIAKNSWGTAWGIQGYFYISYYDANIAMGENYVFDGAQSVTNYAHNYQYDPLGWTENASYGCGSTTGWFANIFTAIATEQVSAVSFYTAALNSTYQVQVYTGVGTTPTSGQLAGTTSGSISTAGYHTITLSSPVSVTSGQKFSVVVQLTTPGYNYPIPIEAPISGYSSGATSSAGQSFIGCNGSSWSDMTSIVTNTNVCLKAFTTSTTPTTYTVTPSAGANGTINPSTAQTVASGSTTQFTVTPNTGYTASVGGTCGGSLVGTTYTTSPITANCTVAATFTSSAGNCSTAISIGLNSSTNGSISTAGQNIYYTVNVPQSGTLDIYTTGSTDTYGYLLDSNCNVITYNDDGGGSYGTNFHINQSVTSGTYYIRVRAYSSTATGSFVLIVGFTSTTYSVTPSAGANGTISPSTPQTVASGSTTQFTITPNTGYTALVGGSCGGSLVGTTYTTAAITASCTVSATFHHTVSDFDGDGKSDILLQNSSTGDVAIWLMNGTTIKSGGTVFSSLASSWQIKGVGDFDGDGKSDILFRNSSTGDVVIWLMNGTTIKSSAYVYTSLASSWQIAGVGDFDG